MRDKDGCKRQPRAQFGRSLTCVIAAPSLSSPDHAPAGSACRLTITLDGPGVEVLPNGERYEGGFRAGKRNGYGQVAGADEKVQSGRWEDGKLVESAP